MRAAARPLELFLVLVVVAVFGSAGIVLGVVQWLSKDLPTRAAHDLQTPVKTVVYDAKGRVLHEFFKEPLPRSAQADSAESGERDALHRGSQFLRALGRRPLGRRPRDGHERAQDAPRRGRQRDHPATCAQSVPHARAHARAQAQGSRARRRDRAQLLEESDSRAVLQPDLFRRARTASTPRQDVLRQARPGADAVECALLAGLPANPTLYCRGGGRRPPGSVARRCFAISSSRSRSRRSNSTTR
jgi:hypothetical protein